MVTAVGTGWADKSHYHQNEALSDLRPSPLGGPARFPLHPIHKLI